MSDNASPASLIPKTIHRRPGTVGRMMNTVRSLKHEANRKERLHWAIRNNNVDEALRLIKESGMTANDINKIVNGWTFIYTASRHGNIDIARALIEAGADVNKTSFDTTPVFIATKMGYIDIIRLLIEAGADVNIGSGYYKETPIYGAIREHIAMSFVIETDKGNINPTEIIRLLIEAGADVNKPQKYDYKAPLILASLHGDIDSVKILIAAGAELNKQDYYANTALHSAIQQGHPDIVRELVRAGADINKMNLSGELPLDIARKRGNSEIINMLTNNLAPNGPNSTSGGRRTRKSKKSKRSKTNKRR